MVDTRPAKKSLDGIQGEADRLPRGIPVPVSKSECALVLGKHRFREFYITKLYMRVKIFIKSTLYYYLGITSFFHIEHVTNPFKTFHPIDICDYPID